MMKGNTLIKTKIVLATKSNTLSVNSTCHRKNLPIRHLTVHHYLTCINSQRSWHWLFNFGIIPLLFYSTSSFPASCLWFLFIQVSKTKNAFQIKNLTDAIDTKGTRIREVTEHWLRARLGTEHFTHIFLLIHTITLQHRSCYYPWAPLSPLLKQRLQE